MKAPGIKRELGCDKDIKHRKIRDLSIAKNDFDIAASGINNRKAI